MATVKKSSDNDVVPAQRNDEGRAYSGAELRDRRLGQQPTLPLESGEVANTGESTVHVKTPQRLDGMALPDQGPALGTVIDGRYRLDGELGRGGMGQVFLGHHLALDTPVAVKVMLPGVASDPVLVRRFQREARATSALQHRNIVKVLDFGVHAGAPYIVMEFLAGEPLSLRLALQRQQVCNPKGRSWATYSWRLPDHSKPR